MTEKTRKADLVQLCVTAPKPKMQKVWCRSEEAALVALKNPQMELKQTALGTAASQMARAVTNSLAQLDDESIAALKTALQDHEEGQAENVI